MKKIICSISLAVLFYMFISCGNTSNNVLDPQNEGNVGYKEDFDFSEDDTIEVVVRSGSGDSYCSKYRGKKCSVQGPSDVNPCSCSGFSCSNRDASICVKCGHKAIKHTR